MTDRQRFIMKVTEREGLAYEIAMNKVILEIMKVDPEWDKSPLWKACQDMANAHTVLALVEQAKGSEYDHRIQDRHTYLRERDSDT